MLIFLLACNRGDKAETSSPPPDLTETLAADEARAGVVTDTAALFGGVSAEGQAGDVKLYNDRVQFVIQAVRDGGYYVTYGGGLIDADIVRPAGQPGRDLIDEALPMVGFGTVADATEVEVISDGADGGAAVVRATAQGAPFLLIEGALESEDAVPDRDVQIATEYRLDPGSPLLKVTTTLTWADDDARALCGDLFLVALDVADPWYPGAGLGEAPDESTWLGLVARDNAVSLGVFPDDVPFESSVLTSTIQDVAPALVPLVGSHDVSDGSTWSWSRYVGVGPDLATLTDAWYAAQGASTETLRGRVVVADGTPVAGARVHLLDADGAPVTLAVTDGGGNWSATLPVGEVMSAVATGRGHGVHPDTAPGAGWYGPYAAAEARELALTALSAGATPVPFAEGYGSSEAVTLNPDSENELSLTAPGFLAIDTGDSLPAAILVDFTGADPAPGDEMLVPDRPGGHLAQGWSADGAMAIPVEPGTYEVLVHRGVRHEVHTETVTVASGETIAIDAPLSEAYSLDGVWRIDPHSHASPSGDGDVPMEHRLLVQASQGVDIHVGTDHDHVADYRPLLAPLGLASVFASVVADEVSPVLRGHFNAYPLEEAPEEPNHGAVRWWEETTSTEALFGKIRAMAGGDQIVQVNHPAGNKGMMGYSGYDAANGSVDDADRWCGDFDAIEVLNSGEYDEYLPFYLDLTRRGYTPTPTGVSDSHGYRSDDGISFTFLDLGIDAVTELSSEALLSAMERHATVVSRGPYLDATIDGAWAPGQTVTGAPTLEVAVLAPSWMPVDTLTLYRDGEAIEARALGGTAPSWGEESFTLSPEADAVYVVIASSDTPMSGPWAGQTAWAMTAAIRVDVAGDGFDAPWPALTIE